MLYCVVLPLKHALSVPPKRTALTDWEVNVAMTSYKSKLWNRLTEACCRRTCSKTSVRTRCVLQTLAEKHKTHLVMEWYKLERGARSCPLVSRVRILPTYYLFSEKPPSCPVGPWQRHKGGKHFISQSPKLKKYLPIPNL